MRPSSSSSSSRSDNGEDATAASKLNYRSVTLQMQHVDTAQGQGPDETDVDEDEGGISYIDHSMLLTQSSQTVDAASGAANHRSASHSFGFNSNSSSNSNGNASIAVRPEIDLFESISRVKRGALPVASSANTVVVKPNTSSTSSSSSSLSSFSQEGIRKPAPPSAVAFSWNAKSIAPKPEPIPLSQPTKPTQKPSRSTSMHTSSINTSSSSSSSSTYPINSTTTQLLNDTQQALGSYAFRAFEDIVRRMNMDGCQGIDIFSSIPYTPSKSNYDSLTLFSFIS